MRDNLFYVIVSNFSKHFFLATGSLTSKLGIKVFLNVVETDFYHHRSCMMTKLCHSKQLFLNGAMSFFSGSGRFILA